MEMDCRNKLVLAPMVRVGTLPFRLLAAEYDADITYGEEIIDHRLLKYERRFSDMFAKRYLELLIWLRKKTINFVMRTCPEERGRVVLQTGTSDAIRALRAAETVQASGNKCIHNFDGTLKFSVDVFYTHNDAATLRMRCLDVAAIDVYMSCPKSFSISGRLLTGPEFLQKWSEIAGVVAVVSIPVIENGDVFEYKDIQRIKVAK